MPATFGAQACPRFPLFREENPRRNAKTPVEEGWERGWEFEKKPYWMSLFDEVDVVDPEVLDLEAAVVHAILSELAN